MKAVKKDIKSDLDGKETAALNLAKSEWNSSVGIEVNYGSIEYETGEEMYTIKLGSRIDARGPGIMDFDDFPDPFRDRNRIRPPPKYNIQTIDARGTFDVDMEKEEIVKQKIEIKEKETSWEERDPWFKKRY